MRLARLALLGTLGLAACAGPRALRDDLGGSENLGGRLASRAASFLGHAGSFRARGERFPADCSGFVEAAYALEGIPLRGLMTRAAPRETSGTKAAYRASAKFGMVFGGGGEWPRPGDLIFFHDTYERDQGGRTDGRLTHVGVVESVVGGTVVFLHRGSKAVQRGFMTPSRSHEALGESGQVLNTPLRMRKGAPVGAKLLAGELFSGYGRIEPARIPRDLSGAETVSLR